MSNFKFQISVGLNGFTEKPSKDNFPKIKYIKTDVDLGGFKYYLEKGYPYLGIYDEDKFDSSLKKKEHYIGTYVISIDIDNGPLSMDNAIKILKSNNVLPSINYETFSSINGDKFRLVYVFDNIIKGEDKVRNYSLSLCKLISCLLNVPVEKHNGIDTASYSPTQYFNGTNKQVYNNDIIYNIDSFKFNDSSISSSTSTKVSSKCIQRHHHNIGLTDTFEKDTTLIKDFWKLNLTEFLYKYDSIMPNIQNSKIDIPSEDEPFIDIPSDYREIHRYWYLLVDEKGNKLDYVRKIKDGEGRRKKLFINGIIRRLINPSITFENMLHNITWEFVTYMINDGNKITKAILFSIVQDIMKTDMTRYSELGKTTRKWMVNPYFSTKYGMSKREVINKFKLNKKQYIGEFYDCSLSDKENIEMMKEYGFEISLITLKRWRKENNIRKYKAKH